MTVTDTTTDPLQAGRVAALEDSGWGRRPKLYQPHNFAFWVLAFLFLAGVFNTYIRIAPQLEVFTNSTVTAMLVFSVLTALLWWLISSLDRYSSIPSNVRIVSFLYGGLVATFAIAIYYNEALFEILAKTGGPSFQRTWGAAFAGPSSEEIAKGLSIILLIAIVPRVVRTAHDGLIIGMFTGLGFQVFENLLYVTNAVGSGFGEPEAGLAMIQLRLSAALASHWCYSAVFCAGVVYLLGRPAQPRRAGLGAGLIALSIGLHFVWNAAAPIADGNGALMLPLMAGVILLILTIIWKLYHYTVTTEQDWMRDVLAPEVSSGVLTDAEVDAAVASWRQRRKFAKSKDTHAERRAEKHIVAAARDLADELADEHVRGTSNVEYARAEITRLRSV